MADLPIALQTFAQLQALFAFLRRINPHYQYYTLDLPTPNGLLAAKMGT